MHFKLTPTLGLNHAACHLSAYSLHIRRVYRATQEEILMQFRSTMDSSQRLGIIAIET
jgi:hypothetical protein